MGLIAYVTAYCKPAEQRPSTYQAEALSTTVALGPKRDRTRWGTCSRAVPAQEPEAQTQVLSMT